jgi:hypothetical protein
MFVTLQTIFKKLFQTTLVSVKAGSNKRMGLVWIFVEMEDYTIYRLAVTMEI